MPTCLSCDCSALVYNFLAVKETDLQKAELAGYRQFELKDIAFLP